MSSDFSPDSTARFSTLIFDLDDTLADTHGQLIKPAWDDVFHFLIGQGIQADIDELRAYYRLCHDDGLTYSFLEKLIAHFTEKFDPTKAEPTVRPELWLAQAKEVFYQRDVPPTFRPFEVTRPLLSRLKAKYRLFLVTAGAPATQRKKVEILGLNSFFVHCLYVDVFKNETKLSAFNQILMKESGQRKRYLAIGNRLDSEIRDAKALGFSTCYVRHGEHANSIPRDSLEEPDMTIQSLGELEATCRL